MAIITFPRRSLAEIQWRQPGGRAAVQRSAFTGRARELDFGPAARWQAEGRPVPLAGAPRLAWAAFEAQCQVPGNQFRLPATVARQFAGTPNIVANPDLAADAAGWVLPAATARVADAWPSPIDWFFRAEAGAARSIEANGGANWQVTAGQTLFIETWAFRSGAGVACNVALQWRNASDAVISTSTLVLAPAAGSWAMVRGSAVAPAGTAFVRIRYDVGAFGSGYLGVTGLRVALLPTVAAVSGAANAGRSLALSGLGPSLMHLRAGQLITVTLPAGDEQLIRLAGDLTADGSGNATAALATPLRATPAAAAVVELDRPWGLMRATNLPGWQARPGGIHGFEFTAEEAF